jgi:hypothetical protein
MKALILFVAVLAFIGYTVLGMGTASVKASTERLATIEAKI